MRLLPFILFLATLASVPLLAQNLLEEPDPFSEVGEKKGDPDAKPADRNAIEIPMLQNLPEIVGDGGKVKEKVSEEKKGDAAEKAPLDAQISQHIQKLAEAERDNRMSFMRIVIDDIVRLCELDEKQREDLELAAKGASERSMKEWHEQAERYFRTRLESADPDAAKEMLEGMGSVNFGGNRAEEEGETLDLWKDSLKNVLTDAQVKRYEEILEQREADRIDAFARMSISTIDDHLRLTPDQKSKLGAIVQASAADYLEDVQRYWGDYFERGMLMSLVNAAEEDELKAILTEKQFDRLRDATSNFDHFWDQKRRLRRAKEKASERRKDSDAEKEYEKKEAAPAEGAEIRRAIIGAGGGVIRVEGGNGIIIKGNAGGVKIIDEPKEAPPAVPQDQ
ncbi:MAG: hypothetical protein KDN18_18305 [Verrucomicrobiae bacterium]|nr:hypothetical protein [Verrucomicrobiae bacterium]